MPDWNDVALNGRRMILAYDGDVQRKESVRTAMDALAKYLSIKGAHIEYLWLPDGDEKFGLDDYLVSHSVDELWTLVKPISPPLRQNTPPDRQGEPVKEPSPPPDADGAALLAEVHATLTRYVAFVDEHQPVAITLWVAATHGLRAWQHATRLTITSPSKRCGKSRLLDIVAGLSFSSLMCGDISAAAIYRSIGDDDDKTPVLFIDEADTMFSTKRAAEQNEDLRGLLNNGWQRRRPVRRCVGPAQTPTDFATFAMAALASKGAVLPDTVTDRAVNIALRRRGPGEKVARFRIRRDHARLAALCNRLTGWVRAHIDELADAEFDGIGVEDRAADAWEPLLAVAGAAGGDWPGRAAVACRALCDAAEDADDDLGVLLLSDIRQVFTDTGQEFLSSNELVRELRAVEQSPWGDEPHPISASKLARLLKGYRVAPGHNAARTVRGYTAEQFSDPWRRYLRPNRPTVQETIPDQPEQHSESGEAKVSSGRPEPSETSETSTTSDTLDGFGRPWTPCDGEQESPVYAGQNHSSGRLDGLDAKEGTGGDMRRCECGNELVVEESVRRGCCTRCFLVSKRKS